MIKHSSFPTIRRLENIRSWAFTIKSIIGEARVWLSAAVALTFLSLLPIWQVRFLPLEDYPYHLFKIHVLANYTNPAFDYQALFQISLFPLPYILVDYLLLILLWFFPLQTAGKIVLSLYVVLLPWSTFYFIRSVDKHKTLLGFFSFLFIYSWFFNKGFVSFVFSLPFILFAVGYWWRVKDALTWKRQVILACLILVVYLSHIFSFILLGCILGLLIVLSYIKNIRSLALSLIPFLPSVILFGIAFISQVSNYSAGGNAVVFFYRSFSYRLVDTKRYLVSYASTQDGFVILLASLLALALLLGNIRRLWRNPYTYIWVMLLLLYLLLPTDIVRALFFSCRVLILLVFFGLPLLAVPQTPLLRNLMALALVILSVFHITFTLRNYQLANQGLRDYYAAINQTPTGAVVLFQADPALTQGSRIPYYQFFGAYYYMEKGGDQLPALLEDGGFIGPFRSVKLNPNPSPSRVTQFDNVTGPLGKRVDQGGYAIFLSQGQSDKFKDITRRYGYGPALAVGNVVLYQREWVPAEPRSRREITSINYKPAHEYLVLYYDLADVPASVEQDFERIFSQGYAHVFKRQTAVMNKF